MNDKQQLVEKYIDVIWHYYFKDNLSFDFCAGIIMQEEHIEISGEAVSEALFEYCRKEFGISFDEECPLCGARTTMKRSGKGLFVGCSNYPDCNFLASARKKFTTKEKYLECLEKENCVIDEAKTVLANEGEKLYDWMCDNIKFVSTERSRIFEHMNRLELMPYETAKKVLTIYKKAKNLGYPERNSDLYDINKYDKYIEKMIDEYHRILKAQNPQMTRDEARERYSNWYKNNFGISFDDLCPLCNSKLMLGRGRGSINSVYNHFIGCRNYPNCRFSANKKLKVLSETETVVIKNDEDASKNEHL